MKRRNKAQKAWCTNYQNETGFDPLMDDFYAGNETFVQAAKKSVRWFESWASDAHLNIGKDIPGEYDNDH